jgi:hypothetical protein
VLDREKKQVILNMCPNYDKISNHIYIKKDEISKQIISQYQEFVFSIDINNEEDKKKLLSANKVLERYINDYKFAKELNLYMNKENKIKDLEKKELMQIIIDFAENYEEEALRHISTTRWL